MAETNCHAPVFLFVLFFCRHYWPTCVSKLAEIRVVWPSFCCPFRPLFACLHFFSYDRCQSQSSIISQLAVAGRRGDALHTLSLAMNKHRVSSSSSSLLVVLHSTTHLDRRRIGQRAKWQKLQQLRKNSQTNILHRHRRQHPCTVLRILCYIHAASELY